MVRLRKAVVFYSKSGVAPKSERAIEKGQKGGNASRVSESETARSSVETASVIFTITGD
jgi:hypothetical protein